MLSLSNINVLIISPEDWGPCWVSKHHYAVELAKRGCRVFFLNRSTEESILEDCRPPEDVTVLPAQKLPRGVRFLPSALRKRAHKKAFQQLAEIAGVEKFDLVWSFDASRYLDLSKEITGCPSIFFMADFAENLPWGIPASTATLCLGVSYAIVERLREHRGSAFFVHHGYAEREQNVYRFSSEGPNAVYSGSIAHPILDVELVRRLAQAYPYCSFHFFGDDGSQNLGNGEISPNKQILEQIANCHLEGPTDQKNLSAIYTAAHALLIPYKREFDKIGNPHKMMEYLASGTPILSTRLKEYEELQGEVIFEDEPSRYIAGLGLILQGGYSASARQRRDFAYRHTYAKQIERIEAYLTLAINSAVAL